MPGLLSPRGGLLTPPPASRNIRTPGQAPQQGPGWMGMGGMGGGQDAPAFDPGAGIWREIMQGLSQQGIGALAPSMAGKTFSPASRKLLGGEYLKKGKK